MKYLSILVPLSLLLGVYLFQHISYTGVLNHVLPDALKVENTYVVFSFNRLVRVLLNDVACLFLIHMIFKERKYVRVAFFVLVIELLVILPVYLFIKLYTEGTSEISSPLLSQVHRMIVNPLLMFLLMIGFFYQTRMIDRKA